MRTVKIPFSYAPMFSAHGVGVSDFARTSLLVALLSMAFFSLGCRAAHSWFRQASTTAAASRVGSFWEAGSEYQDYIGLLGAHHLHGDVWGCLAMSEGVPK